MTHGDLGVPQAAGSCRGSRQLELDLSYRARCGDKAVMSTAYPVV